MQREMVEAGKVVSAFKNAVSLKSKKGSGLFKWILLDQ